MATDYKTIRGYWWLGGIPMAILSLIRLFTSSPYGITPDDFARRYAAKQPLPLFTMHNPKFSINDAYHFQDIAVAALKNDFGRTAGYKSGFTGAQRPFGATESVVGELLDSMLIHTTGNSAEIIRNDYISPLLECEICYHFGKDLPANATSDDIRRAIDSIAPAIEIPDMLFNDMKHLTWLDITACNVGARTVIVGKMQPFPTWDVNGVQVMLSRADTLIASGKATEVMGDQWKSLAFVVKNLENRGKRIHKGNIIISGTMTPILPGREGRYSADFGALGRIAFAVK